MCGILFARSSQAYEPPSSHLALISHRGPDGTHTQTRTLTSCTLSFTSSLLSLRGSTPTHQPLVNPTTSAILCWNGEAWRVHGRDLEPGLNDSKEIFALLQGGAIRGLVETEGEYAFVFYDAPSGKVWYGRDWLGRRSLVKRMVDGVLEVASVSDGTEGWEEVDAGGLWCLNVESGDEKWVTVGEDGEEIWPRRGLEEALTAHDLGPDSKEVEELHRVLNEAVKTRARGIPDPSSANATAFRNGHRPAKLAVLFSGGVDCTMLARIVHDNISPDEPVDLLNVAFENPRIVAARKAQPNGRKQILKTEEINALSKNLDPYALCPDRSTGLSSYRELCHVCPNREWRFVAINIPYGEVLEYRSAVISLMAPHKTEMDLSIALAFYFASRGRGRLMAPLSSIPNTEYTTCARILLSGLGADELFGGYTRHATAFSRNGYPGLISELQLDTDRLGKRNLGRDDRVVSHWGKEVRYPFLDEQVVNWAVSTPVTLKCPFGQGDHHGLEFGKMILRLLARQLGMDIAAGEAKRAVQFGSRSAKMQVRDRKMKGTDGVLP